MLNLPMPDHVLLVEARPAYYDDGIILHLREVEGKPATVRFDAAAAGDRRQFAHEVNVLEETLKADVAEVRLEPWAVKFIKLTHQP